MEQVFVHSYGEESYGIVYRTEDGQFEVCEVPQYGGEEQYYNTYSDFDQAVKVARTAFI